MRLLRAIFVLVHLTVIAAAALGLSGQLPAPLRVWLDLAGGAPRAPVEAPVTLHLEIATGEERQPLPPSWQRAVLSHPRTRQALARHAVDPDPAAFDQLGTWLARQVAADYPQATHLHARLEPATVPPLRFSLDKHR